MTSGIKNKPEDFWNFVEPVPFSGCWIWIGTDHGSSNYGTFAFSGKTFKAHRFSWELRNGKIPSGMSVLHRCDVGFCVNPDHLFIGTQLDNVKDMISKGRSNPPSGENHHRAILTESDIVEIKRLSSLGFSYPSLANVYGVHRSTIRRAAIGITWNKTHQH